MGILEDGFRSDALRTALGKLMDEHGDYAVVNAAIAVLDARDRSMQVLRDERRERVMSEPGFVERRKA